MALATAPCDSSADAQIAAKAAEWGVDFWAAWLAAILPTYCTARMAEHHKALWAWVDDLEPGVRPEAFIGVWPRGGAKSTSAEAACVMLGARRKRRYGLYVCDTQDRADDHVGNVGSMLESRRVEMFYPALAQRRVGKHGNSRGWRRNRLWTADGFVIDAIGLDTAARGVKLEDQRPDFLVIDDVDGEHDTPKITRRKIDTLTKGILPAGASDLAVLAVQNLIQPNGVFARLVDGRADFLRRRVVSGPVPALHGFRVDAEGVVHGTPTWDGQDLETCRAQAEDWGLTAFRTEAQHDVAAVEGAYWAPAQLESLRRAIPELVEAMVGVDPSGGDTPENDEQGIVVVGRDAQGNGFVLADATDRLTPDGWGRKAVTTAIAHDADIVVETNYGGDMAVATITTAARTMGYGTVVKDAKGQVLATTPGKAGVIVIHKISASRGKLVRVEPIAALYGSKDEPESWERARMFHVGSHPELEDEMTSYQGFGDSPNRLDALVWAATKLFFHEQTARRLSFRGAA